MKGQRLLYPYLTSRYIHKFGEGELSTTEIITGLLQTVYKLDKPAIDEILTPGATAADIQAKIFEVDRGRVRTLTEKIGGDKYKQGFAEAKKTVLTEREKALKDHFGIESDLTGIELDEHIVATKAKEAGATTEDAIKKTPTYQALENKLKSEVKRVTTEFETKIKTIEGEYSKKEAFTTVGTNALNLLNGMNPILPKNATVAQTQKNNYLKELEGYEYELQDDKILVSKGGKLLQDEHGNTLSYDDHVKKVAERHFEFAANNGGENSGNDGVKPDPKDGKTQPAYPAGIKKPTNDAELSEVLNGGKLKTPAEKRVVMDEFQKQYGKK